ncbi:type 1 periplasmic binding fold superfamily protein [Lewinella sp. JB7]|uniref:type 1 periplasmic binding fold superfamily protein n=1 Tax=Lewinella sp. JB7 TaxID=2962887 RepID=UPI0020C99C91|nr:type 1 periplasmic binding fold superfamily protein [Lewinella sp. JB7]MCP9235616.1 type 1 periplasmic binding fold superfamily protein [Lewinella sp. JB7]
MTKYFAFVVISLLLIAACGSDDDPILINEEEVITDVTYTLSPVGGGDAVVLSFSDPDGDGGTAPTQIVSGNLSAGTTYEGRIQVLNSASTPPVDITTEIEDEAADHQFFFVPDPGLDVQLTYLDSDGNGDPVGLRTELRAGSFSSGNLVIILRHEPNKAAAGVGISTPASAGGETDIEISFPVSIGN